MSYMRIQQAGIEVHDYNSLLEAWRLYGGPLSIVGSFIVTKRLTKTQLRRLPRELKRRLQVGTAKTASADDSLDFLERLYRLEDPRDSAK